jgi:hypothetical protein
VADLLAPIQQIPCDVGMVGLDHFKLDTGGLLAFKRLRSNALLLIVLLLLSSLFQVPLPFDPVCL